MMKEEKQKPDASPEETGLLGANHRRVLALAYRQLERAAWQLEMQLTREQSPHLTLTRVTEEFDPIQQAALRNLLKRIRQEVETVAARYHFASQGESRRRAVAAEFAILWSHLEEMRPHRLRAYGVLSVHMEEELTPVIQQAIDLVLAVQAIAEGEQEVIQAWQEVKQKEGKEETHGETEASDEND